MKRAESEGTEKKKRIISTRQVPRPSTKPKRWRWRFFFITLVQVFRKILFPDPDPT